MDNLNNIWNNVSMKPFIVQSTDGTVMRVTAELNNGWYEGETLNPFSTSAITSGYLAQVTVIVNGTDAIWTVL